MHEVVRRVQQALPAICDWVADLQAEQAPHSVAPSTLGFKRLSLYYPAPVLEAARFVPVEEVPFPPVVELGVPEFASMASMPMAGITFGDTYFIRAEQASEPLHFHELVHVIQWSTLGVPRFLLTYAIGILQHGYEGSPFEIAAYDLQAKFERGELLPDVVDFIRWHSLRTRDDVARWLRSRGMDEGA